MPTFFNILGPIVFGIAVTGVLVFMKRVLKVPLPGWSVPMLAAASIILAHVYNEYSWFDRFSAELPEQVEVVETLTKSSWYEPWSYVRPRVDRFTAIDRNSVQFNPAHPELALGEIILVQRYTPTARALQIADCENGRVADLTPSTEFGDDGLPLGVVWFDRDAEDPVLASLCRIAAEKRSN
ncbi:hypothetical protein [uncultured Hoeflea sp.]|uniref:hypothetical protein n=1 Tax=uncultured Hoeflea sp. TaxID=538666 RepID=UPI0026245A0D|nr:hypothetical protein [uncultured Hoeflea sp.]